MFRLMTLISVSLVIAFIWWAVVELRKENKNNNNQKTKENE